MGKIRCFECGNKSQKWIYKKTKRKYQRKGYCFELEVETPYCERCGAPIYDKEIEQKIREQAHTLIKEQTRLRK